MIFSILPLIVRGVFAWLEALSWRFGGQITDAGDVKSLWLAKPTDSVVELQPPRQTPAMA